MNDAIRIISENYKQLFGNLEIAVTSLPQSGSDRKYFRILTGGRTVIGAFNPNKEENEAFMGFTNHFISKELPVPEIYGYLSQKFTYYLQDLGDNNLFTWFYKNVPVNKFNDESEILFRKILDKLVLFQVEGIKGLNLELCYPHKSFDRQSMMWDMNYFKYMFLKLIAVPFNEKKLEHDFDKMADWLLAAGQDYFLYRDFQSANIMIAGEEPWFIDYQGGRKGAPQYDLASFLYDAKLSLTHDTRLKFLDYYTRIFCDATGNDRDKFKSDYTGFALIRLMQALGAFGFRGLYENKPTFTDSIVPAVGLLEHVIRSSEEHISLPELYQTIHAIRMTAKFQQLAGSLNEKNKV